jgi:predicted nucleic acid-binding protein
MPGKNVFLDSNILVYVYSEDEVEKREKSRSLYGDTATISTQVLNEVANVFLLKFRIAPDDVARKIRELSQGCKISVVDFETVMSAIRLHREYGYSYFDSLMLASALREEFSTIYTEDMQNGQVIDGTLTIVNPFKQ